MKYPAFTGDEPCAQTGADFFISDGDSNRYRNVRQLRAICGACPMQEPCLEYALHVKVVGFWGGTTDEERRRIRRRRGIRAARILEIA